MPIAACLPAETLTRAVLVLFDAAEDKVGGVELLPTTGGDSSDDSELEDQGSDDGSSSVNEAGASVQLVPFRKC